MKFIGRLIVSLIVFTMFSANVHFSPTMDSQTNSNFITAKLNQNTAKKISENHKKTILNIPIFVYHHLAEDQETPLIVHPEKFRQQMEYVKSQGFTTINDEDLVLYYEGKKELPKKPILITFDDGYESNYIYAYPILKELNMKATIFIIVDMIENMENHTSPYPKLRWNQIKELTDSGLISIQSHSFNLHIRDKKESGIKPILINGRLEKEIGIITHPILINGVLETNSQYEKRVLDDLVLSKKIIEEKTGKTIYSFAYPFGHYTNKTEELVKKAGFKLSHSIDFGYNTLSQGPYLLKRAGIPGALETNYLPSYMNSILKH